MNKLKCLVCGKENILNLSGHIIRKHTISVGEYIMRFDYRGKFNITTNKPCCCIKCKKEFTDLKYFYRKKHLEKCFNIFKEDNDEYIKCNDEYIKCNICKKLFIDVKQHIIYGHRIDWTKYCDMYNFDVNYKRKFKNEHINNLSKNKKNFYKSEKGICLKHIQSEKIKGDLNYSRTDEFRKNQSVFMTKSLKDSETYNKYYNKKNIIKHIENVPIKTNYIGLKFKIDFGNKIKWIRSFNELKFILLLLDNGINFEYESTVLEYNLNNKNKFKLIDFIVSKNTLVELKSSIAEVNIFNKNFKYLLDRYNVLCICPQMVSNKTTTEYLELSNKYSNRILDFYSFYKSGKITNFFNRRFK